MKFFCTILLALTATATALPKVEPRACGTNICPGAIADKDAECPLECMWGTCVRYHCEGGYDMICGKNRDSCAKV
ncbi:hypothetical protein QQX98_005131 [Neonectria punicea]|uniref:Uncharacterized protein n=1 Tax=Neonectria punicea TaxID=979145 RepID=A0ABR1H6D6_9HYPO